MHGNPTSPISHDFSPQYRCCTTTVGAAVTTTTGCAIITPGAITGAVAYIAPSPPRAGD